MVNSMMTRSIQNVLQRPETLDGLSVYPEHVEVAELVVHHELGWWYRQRQGQVEYLMRRG